jgi:hypothetical protein
VRLPRFVICGPLSERQPARGETQVVDVTAGQKTEVVGRGQKGRGRGFNKGATWGARGTSER